MNRFFHLIILIQILATTIAYSQKEKLNLRPYSIETTYEHLKKDHPFIKSITPLNDTLYEAQTDVVYKKTETSDLKLDAYYPKDALDQTYPGVLLIHGGGWFSGSKENERVMAQHLAANGYVAVTASYRLGREAIYPAGVLDLKDALRWMQANATQLHLDKNRIATLGASAGAQLAMLLGVTPNSEVFNETEERFSTQIQAIVNVDGVTSFVHPEAGKGALLDAWLGYTFEENPEIWAEASPLEYVSEATPPTLFINSAQPRFHAGRDDYTAQLDVYGIYNEVHTLPNTPHSFWLMHPWFEPTLRYTLNFLDKTLKAPFEDPYRVITVGKEDQADFTSIQEAVNSIRAFGPGEVLISISPGVYKEKLVIPAHVSNVTLQGSGPGETRITYDDHSGKLDPVTGNEHGTFTSHTVIVKGADIHFNNLTIANSSCNEGQAVALHVEGDRFVAEDCAIIGCQDTLYTATEGGRQFYKNCYIEGTTDFIFGQATVVFQGCEIHSTANSYITAAATTQDQEYGYVFFNCKLTAADDVERVYLGRPWRPYARTVFIDTEMAQHIVSEGWHAWPGDAMFPNKEKTAYYAEYKSIGAGASPATRVYWSKQLSEWTRDQYTFKNIFKGWVPNQ